MDLTVLQLTNNTGFVGQPSWSPDGGTIAFNCVLEGGNYDICSINADGMGLIRLTSHPAMDFGATFSPDGETIAFTCEVESGNYDICSINADGMGFIRLTSDPAWDFGATFSPDGLTIALTTTRYGSVRIAVMNPDGTGISQVGAGISGFQLAWSSDSTRIAFVQPITGSCEADWAHLS